MNDDRDEEAIFHLARRIPDPETRKDYLDQICAGDTALRERVEALLKSHEQQHSLLRSKAEQLLAEHEVGDTMSVAQSSNLNLSAGQKIGRYKLLQQIGEGGFGVVFMAEQSRPVRRKVALKVIKPGMDSNAVVARFEAERQALAMMDHPNIARVFDGGATDEGRPYFVMELVKGVPITEYCDKNKLPTKERLELFITVCQAVQHAHQKGIIHRDLKPSNILVTLHDGQPAVKVIDFGVSKAINQQLTEKTLFTAFGQMVGTPQYMSPEQAEMSGLDVDTRSDVYSLGVLLYELLTGSTPLEAERLRTAGYVEMQRLIKEEEPPRPSNRLSTSGEKLTIIAQHRSVTPEKLARQIRGDLDWIVMKALEKERARRYDSAKLLSDDVNNFLCDAIVEARPPSASYRIQRTWRRNRIPITVLFSIILALVGSLGASLWAYRSQKELVTRLRENRIEKIFEAVLVGEQDKAEDEIQGIKETYSDSDQQLELLQAIVKAFGDDKDRKTAAGTLGVMAESGDLSTKALYIASLFYSNREWDYWREVAEVDDANPETFEEHLFLGYALTFGVPSRAVEYLKVARDKKKNSPLTRVLLSRALHFSSQRVLNRQLAIAQAEEALVEARIANDIVQDRTPLFAGSLIDALAKVIDLYLVHGTAEQKNNTKELITRLESELFASSDESDDWRLRQAQMQADRILEKHGFKLSENLRSKIWRASNAENASIDVAVRLIQHWYHEGEVQKAADAAERYRAALTDGQLYGFLPKAELHYNHPSEFQRLVKLATDPQRKDKELNGFADSVLLLLLGQRELAESRAKDQLAFFQRLTSELRGITDFVPVSEYMSGQADYSPDELISQSQDNHGRLHIAFWLGVGELSKGNRELAASFFAQAVQTECYNFFAHEWAVIFLEKLQQPDSEKWLPWLTAESSSL